MLRSLWALEPFEQSAENLRVGLTEANAMKAFDIEAYHELLGRADPIAPEDLFLVIGKVQDTFGSVPRSVVQDLAARSGLGEARIWGALTAYPGFKVTEEA